MHIAVTGASSGIGKAIALAFDSPGNKISLIARRTELLEELKNQINCESLPVYANLADSDHCLSWITKALEAFGPIDMLVNNAGVSYVEPVEQIDESRVDTIFKTNVLTPIKTIQYLLPSMLERRSGNIINITSNAAFSPAPYLCHYTSSKGALGNYSESLNYEMNKRKTGVNILTVYPGPIDTAMAERNWELLDDNGLARRISPIGKPEMLAKKIVRALASKKRRLIYPSFYALSWHIPLVSRLIAAYWVPHAKGMITPLMPGDMVK